MAKRNEVGPTSGKKSTLYIANTPDGQVLVKRSFFIHTEEALMGAFKTPDGKWHASGIVSEVQEWGSQIFLKAYKGV